MVYLEGEPATHAFIVVNGEFELERCLPKNEASGGSSAIAKML